MNSVLTFVMKERQGEEKCRSQPARPGLYRKSKKTICGNMVFQVEKTRNGFAPFMGGGGGGGTGGKRVGLNFPLPGTLYSRFPPTSLVGPASVCFFYCEILLNVAKFISYFRPTPAPLGIVSPALSSPASRTLPAPITPGFPPPCPHPHPPFITVIAFAQS